MSPLRRSRHCCCCRGCCCNVAVAGVADVAGSRAAAGPLVPPCACVWRIFRLVATCHLQVRLGSPFVVLSLDRLPYASRAKYLLGIGGYRRNRG